MEMQATSSSNYEKMDYDESRSWYIISIISWSLMIIAIWTSYHFEFFFWSRFDSYITSYSIYGYFPMELNKSNYNWLYIYIFLLSVLAFGIYVVFTTCKKNQGLYDGMLGNMSKFHFIPLLLIASIFIIGFNSINNDGDILKYYRKLLVFDLIFTILGLISLIFTYIVTQLNSEWYIVLAIKKGIYSAFIIILWYNFFNVIVCLQAIKYFLSEDYSSYYTDSENDPLRKFFKVVGILFNILFFLGDLVFSILFKDIIAAFTTFLMYLGMVEAFFRKDEEIKEVRKEFFNGTADGVLDIIFMLISFGCIFFLVLKCRERIF